MKIQLPGFLYCSLALSKFQYAILFETLAQYKLFTYIHTYLLSYLLTYLLTYFSP